MVDSLCQAYHWTFSQVMSMTLPQIVLMNHAAWYNHEMADRRFKAKQKREEEERKREEANPIVAEGQRVTEMNSDEFARYWGTTVQFGAPTYVETESS